MFRIRQQHWFCLAAVCLVGSLLSIWSMDIPVADEGQDRQAALLEHPVLRRHSDLPESSRLLEVPAGLASGQDFTETTEVLIQAPAGVAGRMASPLNTTGRVISRDRVAPAGFQQAAAVAANPIQLTGQIEQIEFRIDHP